MTTERTAGQSWQPDDPVRVVMMVEEEPVKIRIPRPKRRTVFCWMPGCESTGLVWETDSPWVCPACREKHKIAKAKEARRAGQQMREGEKI